MRGRMYTEQLGWLNTIIGKLDDGMYWHIPRSDSVLRMDKTQKRFVLIKGNKRSTEMVLLANELRKFGYALIGKESEIGYFTQ